MLRRAARRVHQLDRRSHAAVALIIAFAVAVVAAAWITAAGIAVRERDRVMDDARAELLGVQQTFAAHVSRTFEAAQTLVTAVDLWLASSSADGDEALEELTDVVRRLQALHEQPLQVRLIDSRGRFLPFGDLTADDRRVANVDFFRTAVDWQPGDVRIGLPIRSSLTGDVIIPVNARASTNVLGVAVIGVSVPTRQFSDAYRTLLITAPSSSGIVNKDGFVLLRDPDPEGLTGKQLPASVSAVFRADQPAAGIATNYRSASGDDLLVSYAALRRQSLVVYCAFRQADLVARWQGKSRSAYAAAAIATLLTLMAAAGLVGLIMKGSREAARIGAALHAAEEASRAKTDFLAKMSHELRTPLNAIIGFSETIKRSLLGPLPAKYQSYGADIHRSGLHLLSLIEDVLDVARVESGTVEPSDEQVQIADVVDEAARLVAPKLQKSDIALIRRVPEDLPALVADRRMLRQILLNLLSNAARYAGAGATVEVVAAYAGGGIALTVRDTGPGIPEAALAHIFEPFGRGGARLARADGGIGLGLPITKSLVELHGGRIAIDTRVGEGTAITLHFPANRVQPRQPAHSAGD